MNIKRFTVIMAAAVMLVCVLCACGNNNAGTNTETPNTQKPVPVVPSIQATTAPTADNSKTEYKVTVVDQNGSPVAGVVLQFCDDANCKMPVTTDANGVVTASYAPSEYHVTLTQLPDGYTSEATEFYFDGETEMTIELTAGE